VRLVTADVFLMVVVGAAAGRMLGMASARCIKASLYQVEPGEMAMLGLPPVVILAAALPAATPAGVAGGAD
jgi:hypothetical protein